MKRSRKVLSFLTAAAMLGGVAVPAEPLAQLGAVMMVRAEEESMPTSGTCGADGNEENVTWNFDESTGTLTISGTGEMRDYGNTEEGYIGNIWDDLPIVSVNIEKGITNIGQDAFSCCDITSVTIPDSVINIGNAAFLDCSSLTSVTIPDSVTSIGDSAFSSCSGLTSVTIPDSVTSIGNYAFEVCSGLTSVTIPDSVTSIGDFAFYACTGVTSVTIPDSVTTFGKRAFYNTPWLETQLENSPLLIVNDIVIAANVETGTGDVVIPDGVTSIGNGAFFMCDALASVTIPDSVTSIRDYAFQQCTSLTSVVIPESVTSIEYGAFNGCSGLTSVTIPESVTSIENYAFSGCGLTSITILNPDCQIYDDLSTICNDWSTFSGTIYGYDNSTAQAYAEKYGYQFKSIGKAPVSDTLGDVSGDNVINAGDAAMTLSAAAAYGATGSYGDMTDAQIAAADIDGNSMVNASDAAYILQYAAMRGANGKDFDIRELVK